MKNFKTCITRTKISSTCILQWLHLLVLADTAAANMICTCGWHIWIQSSDSQRNHAQVGLLTSLLCVLAKTSIYQCWLSLMNIPLSLMIPLLCGVICIICAVLRLNLPPLKYTSLPLPFSWDGNNLSHRRFCALRRGKNQCFLFIYIYILKMLILKTNWTQWSTKRISVCVYHFLLCVSHHH